MKQKLHVKYIIIDCDHRFFPTPNTYKECKTCELKQGEGDCKVDIMVGERYYVQKKVAI